MKLYDDIMGTNAASSRGPLEQKVDLRPLLALGQSLAPSILLHQAHITRCPATTDGFDRLYSLQHANDRASRSKHCRDTTARRHQQQQAHPDQKDGARWSIACSSPRCGEQECQAAVSQLPRYASNRQRRLSQQGRARRATFAGGAAAARICCCLCTLHGKRAAAAASTAYAVPAALRHILACRRYTAGAARREGG
jgi:hypothetical protein